MRADLPAATAAPPASIELSPFSPARWRQRAACAAPDVDPELFFPEKGGTAAAAKQVCARCPVKAPCLAEALAWADEHGIRGGLTPRERRRLRREPAERAR